MLYLQNYKEFETEILDLQLEKYGLSFDMKKYTTSSWAQGRGGENVIGIRSFKLLRFAGIWDTLGELSGAQSESSCNSDRPKQ